MPPNSHEHLLFLRRNFSQIPPLTSAGPHFGSTVSSLGVFGQLSTMHLYTRCIIATLIWSKAKRFPTQLRGPIPNAKKACGLLRCLFSWLKFSGLKLSGSGKYLSSIMIPVTGSCTIIPLVMTKYQELCIPWHISSDPSQSSLLPYNCFLSS